jgi:hypothetical protein
MIFKKYILTETNWQSSYTKTLITYLKSMFIRHAPAIKQRNLRVRPSMEDTLNYRLTESTYAHVSGVKVCTEHANPFGFLPAF